MGNEIITSYGPVEGISDSTTGITTFLGIPYAKAARWKYPQRLSPWEGTLCADSYGPICIQPGAFAEKNGKKPNFYEHEFRNGIAYDYSNDCLNLNIWTSAGFKNAPVFVYIHGGAFLGGSSWQHCFDGAALVKKGLVVVTVNYRLGIFGGYASQYLAKRDGHTGNYGMYDVLSALQWVHDEITAFGGDPANVTLMGQSAGARMVQLLNISPLTTKLIHKVILSSGAGLAKLFGKELEIDEICSRWEKLLDEHSVAGTSALEQMADQELETFFESCISENFTACTVLCAPAIDGLLLPVSIEKVYEEQSAPDIPLIIGSNAQDLLAEDMHEAVLKWPPNHREHAWHYYFARQLPGDEAGAFHSADLWYWFGTLDRAWRPFEEQDRILSDAMTDCIVNFSQSGFPSSKNMPTWKSVADAPTHVMCFGDKEIQMEEITVT